MRSFRALPLRGSVCTGWPRPNRGLIAPTLSRKTRCLALQQGFCSWLQAGRGLDHIASETLHPTRQAASTRSKSLFVRPWRTHAKLT